MQKYFLCLIIISQILNPMKKTSAQINPSNDKLKIGGQGYYEIQGLNVMVFDDFYPEGHQGGLTIIQSGKRTAANGDLRLEPTPGQWSPTPVMGKRIIDKENGIIKVDLWFPDSTKDKKGFNPIEYPDLRFKYSIKTEAIGKALKVSVDLDESIPEEWTDKIGFNLQLFPGYYFGEHFLMDGKSGIFPRQPTGPMYKDSDGNLQIKPLAEGSELIVVPGNKEKGIKFISNKNKLQLIDGRGLHNNGWFIVRSIISKGETKNAVEWIIKPNYDEKFIYKPVIQISQVGYHPNQVKFAVIELDKVTDKFEEISIIRINEDSEKIIRIEQSPQLWGEFLRYKYLRFDFTDIKEEGLYKIKYGENESHSFEIKKDIYSRHVWHPTLEYFLPVQMCHMRVNDRYKVWHGLCHMDDALMAPTDHNHFDGYIQSSSTLTKYKSGEHVPGLNIGGWHDAGDYDIRIESQSETIYKLSLAYELFNVEYDNTSVNQQTRITELLTPDGIPDILQQIEHGVLSIVGAYESMGRFYRGIIEPTIRQYVHLGDAATMTDNLVYKENENDPILNQPLPKDDRWVFTEQNTRRELHAAISLASASSVLKNYNAELSLKCISIAEEVFNKIEPRDIKQKLKTAAELFLATSKKEYEELLLNNVDLMTENIFLFTEVIGRLVSKLNNHTFTAKIEPAIKEAIEMINEQQKENPYGVPYRPHIWGAGWGIQSFGVSQLFLHIGFPNLFSNEYAFNALNFVLGCHPGENTASFVSGVGVNSLTVAYGVNRDEWSYIPCGVGSGTALIRPDLPELKIWPYLWQQTEYVMGGGTADFLLLAIAADNLFNKK